jgi:pseudaminic acid biosynthesis-associated methylase
MKIYKTEQEKFWAGTFGDDYIKRNTSKKLLESNINLFSEILSKTSKVNTILELGANIGMNIRALNCLLPEAKISAVEINPKAFKKMKKVCTGTAYLQSIDDISVEAHPKYDLVFTKGVLIHINPKKLCKAYEVMYKLSSRYICVAEYYNPFPVAVKYRGEINKLFKRDFTSELMKKYNDLQLINYGFKYRYDNNYPQDDITWFLLEKSQ